MNGMLIMNNIFEDRVVLLTGGTGSFGQNFVKYILKNQRPKSVRIFSRDELKQHDMRQQFEDDTLRFFIGDVRDKERLHRAMHGVDFVIHAAALKQVPSCEYNPFEAVKTNIIGSENVINAAIDCRVGKVLALSTDKAVSPVNLYGATKLCAEKMFVQSNSYTGGSTKNSCVRYGNVIGSRGSVVPLFKKQKEEGVLTLTDKRMTRFWITYEQAIGLVIKSLENMVGGEVFVPKIPSMRILELAKAIGPECELMEIGIRPGEKIHEVLITQEEARNTYEFDEYYLVEPQYRWWDKANMKGGKKVDKEFVYSSDNNEKWLSIEELNGMIKDME
jgi:UDP-N-acetylglucosamine 4,6-dehydratase